VKIIKEKIKLWFVLFLMKITAKIYGQTSLDGFLHNIDFNLLNKKYWNIKTNINEDGKSYKSARYKKYGLFGLCLFDKED